MTFFAAAAVQCRRCLSRGPRARRVASDGVSDALRGDSAARVASRGPGNILKPPLVGGQWRGATVWPLGAGLRRSGGRIGVLGGGFVARGVTVEVWGASARSRGRQPLW